MPARTSYEKAICPFFRPYVRLSLKRKVSKIKTTICDMLQNGTREDASYYY